MSDRNLERRLEVIEERLEIIRQKLEELKRLIQREMGTERLGH